MAEEIIKKVKKKVKKSTKRFKNSFKKKVPVSYPIMYGELLKGKTVLITGGNSGIGYEIAKASIRNGASVIIAGRNIKKNEKAIENLNKLIKEDQFVDSLIFDIEDVKKSIETIEKYLEEKKYKIDVLVNNAGISNGQSIPNTSIEDYEKVLKVNLEGTYFISQSIFKHMVQNNIQGHILNIISSSGNRPAVTPYNVSKWGQKGLTLGMAKKYIQEGIVVNGLAPGPTATGILEVDTEKDGIDLVKNPLKRYAMPEEIANMAVIMCSDLGNTIIGDTLFMTGGAAVVTFDD